jgi:hypothetical protein
VLSESAAAATFGLINSVGQLGGFAGNYGIGFLNSRTGSLAASLAFIALVYVVSATLIVTLRRTTPEHRATAYAGEIRRACMWEARTRNAANLFGTQGFGAVDLQVGYEDSSGAAATLVKLAERCARTLLQRIAGVAMPRTKLILTDIQTANASAIRCWASPPATASQGT